MKKILVGLLAVAFVAGMSGLASAVITGSVHDFSDNVVKGGQTATNENWNGRNEICRVCHVPHDHNEPTQRYLNGLLWNHGVSSATYKMYNNAWSSSLTGTQSAQPDGTSKLCLGCHDGSVAIDTFDKYTGGSSFVVGDSKIVNFMDGTNIDLRGTHPLSIAFPAGQTGDGKNFTNPTVQTWQGGGTVASTLDNGKVQCSTCHDVHNQDAPGAHLLRAAQTVAGGGSASGLCLTCHIK